MLINWKVTEHRRRRNTHIRIQNNYRLHFIIRSNYGFKRQILQSWHWKKKIINISFLHWKVCWIKRIYIYFRDKTVLIDTFTGPNITCLQYLVVLYLKVTKHWKGNCITQWVWEGLVLISQLSVFFRGGSKWNRNTECYCGAYNLCYGEQHKYYWKITVSTLYTRTLVSNDSYRYHYSLLDSYIFINYIITNIVER